MRARKLASQSTPFLFFLAISLACSAQQPFSSAIRTESFDKPLRETVVDLGQSSYLGPAPNSRILLSCFYYPTFMVKQLNDPGVKGTLWVTTTAILNRQVPSCRRSHSAAEGFLAKGWWRFIGIKGELLFLEAADGEDGGMDVRILNLKTGRKIFEDSMSLINSKVDFAYAEDGRMSMRYLRVVRGDCSIPKGGEICWNRFRQQFGLEHMSVPTCAGYEGERPIPVEQERIPSAVTYPVAVELFPRPSIKVVPGPVWCAPQQ